MYWFDACLEARAKSSKVSGTGAAKRKAARAQCFCEQNMSGFIRERGCSDSPAWQHLMQLGCQDFAHGGAADDDAGGEADSVAGEAAGNDSSYSNEDRWAARGSGWPGYCLPHMLQMSGAPEMTRFDACLEARANSSEVSSTGAAKRLARAQCFCEQNMSGFIRERGCSDYP